MTSPLNNNNEVDVHLEMLISEVNKMTKNSLNNHWLVNIAKMTNVP